MRDCPLEKVRNFGIIAHIDAGKTTTSERVLYYTGMTHKIGEVHEGDTITDWMEQEKERGITITAAAITCFWNPTYMPVSDTSKKVRFNIIDTPGHIDFTAEVKRSLHVLDGAVVIFDGVAGVEPQSETNWHYADEENIPRLCFINKLDRMGASFENSFKSILIRLNKNAVRMQIPIGLEENFKGVIDLLTMKAYYFEGDKGEKVVEAEIPKEYLSDAKQHRAELIERIAAEDDDLTHRYLEGKEIPIDNLKMVLRKAVIANKLFPVFVGSALKNKGVQLILDAVVDYLPSPLDIPPVKGINPETGEEVIRHASDEEPFAALAFKLQSDPFVGQLTFFRVYSGTVSAGSYIYNSTINKKERLGRIVRLQADKREEMKTVYAGEIAAAVGLKDAKTSHTFCDENNPIILELIKFMEPVIAMSIEPKTKADQERMGMTLKRLTDEDPTLRIKTNEETGQTIIEGMGELHLEIIVERMKREFKVETNVGKPQVAYKETIKKAAEAEGKYIRQSGGRGQYGHVWLKIEPIERGKGFEFVDAIKGGTIPAEYIPAVKKGVKEAMDRGVLAGYPFVDAKITLYDGSFHEVDSSEAAFKMAGSFALQEAAKRAGLILLEPVMKLEVVIPQEFLGDITGDLSSKRARIEKLDDRINMKVVDAKVPLSEMFGYATKLRSMTQGRGIFTMEFFDYEEIPRNIAQDIIEGKKK